MPEIPKTAEIQILAAGEKIPQLEGTPFYPITEAQLEQLARDYNPQMFEAPVTLDHEQSGPSYGWVERLERRGKALYAHVRDLAGELVELVRSKRYKKISAEIDLEFYKTGKPYIKGFSFLGAGKPAVAGMADPVLSESGSLLAFLNDKQKKIVCTPDRELYEGEVAMMPQAQFDFENFDLLATVQDEKETDYLSRILNRFKDAVWNVQTSDRTDKADLIRKYTAQLQKAVSDAGSADLSDKNKGGATMSGENKELEVKLQDTQTKLAATEGVIAKLREENKAKEARLSEMERKLKAQDIAQALDKLVAEGKLTPAERKNGNLDVVLLNLPDTMVKLGDKEVTLRENLLATYAARMPVVRLGVALGPEGETTIPAAVLPHGVKPEDVNQASADFAEKVREVQLRDKCDYTTAMTRANQENPGLYDKTVKTKTR